MAYTAGDFDRDHIQVTWGGSLPGNETWSCSLKMADARPGSPVIGNDAYIATMDMGDYADFVKTPIQNFHEDAGSNINPAAVLRYVKVAKIQHDGKMDADDSSEEFVYAGDGIPGGGSTGLQYPNQCSLVVSLTTRVTRGPAHRGRFYMPLPSHYIGADGCISIADAQAVADSAAAFIESISDVPGLDIPSSPGVVVMSRKSSAARTYNVEGVEVGRVIDTQRRRRRSLPENYATAGVSQGIA
jgi:hypothetical protein